MMNGAMGFEGGASFGFHSRQATNGLIEPVSNRELEVLRLIAEGLSNQEIAEELVISVHTVKRHAFNLYSKLGVKRRTQAIMLARSLALL